MDTIHDAADNQPSGTIIPAITHHRATVAMDTLVNVRVDSARPADDVEAAMNRALAWFAEVERVCSRFDPESELVRLCRRPGEAVPVSNLLFEAVAFALSVAEATNGAFDPTVGGAQQARGFTRNYITGQPVVTATAKASYRHVRLDRAQQRITLRRPLLLDLGAVAKGLALDLAARELMIFERFGVEAGGDIIVGGADPAAPAWRIGVRDPHGDGLLGTLMLHRGAVCTSGGSERPATAAGGGEHHLLDPRSRRSPRALTGVTVVAATGMVADALATAVYILGPEAGVHLLDDQGLAGVLVTANDDIRVLPGRMGDLTWTATPQPPPAGA